MSGTNGHSNGDARGGKGGGLDPHHVRRDAALVRQAISSGWGVTREELLKYRDALAEALEIARAKGNARDVRGCVNTMKGITDQIQRDEHREEPVKIDHRISVEYVNKWEPQRT